MHKIGKKVKLSALLYGALVSPGALGDGLTKEKNSHQADFSK